MKKAQLMPTSNNTYRIVYTEGENGVACDFGTALVCSERQEESEKIHEACDTRFKAFQQLMHLIPETENIELEWDDDNSRNAMLLIYYSAIDHFLIGDFEMSGAMFELLLDLDPEDHLYASKPLAYAYLALEEYELFDEVLNDVSDKYPDKSLLAIWSDFRRTNVIPEGELRRFKQSFEPYYNEFISDDHTVDEEYLSAIDGERPPKWALARELWLQTEHLWALFPDFIEALKKA